MKSSSCRGWRARLTLGFAAMSLGVCARGNAEPRKGPWAGGKVNLDAYTRVAKGKLIAQKQVDDQAMLVGQLEGSVRMDQAQIEQAMCEAKNP